MRTSSGRLCCTSDGKEESRGDQVVGGRARLATTTFIIESEGLNAGYTWEAGWKPRPTNSTELSEEDDVVPFAWSIIRATSLKRDDCSTARPMGHIMPGVCRRRISVEQRPILQSQRRYGTSPGRQNQWATKRLGRTGQGRVILQSSQPHQRQSVIIFFDQSKSWDITACAGPAERPNRHQSVTAKTGSVLEVR